MKFRKIIIVVTTLLVSLSVFAEEAIKSKNSDIFDFSVSSQSSVVTDSTLLTTTPLKVPEKSTDNIVTETKTVPAVAPEIKTTATATVEVDKTTKVEIQKAETFTKVQLLLFKKYQTVFDKVFDDIIAGFERDKKTIPEQIAAMTDLRSRLQAKIKLIQEKKDLDILTKETLTPVIQYVIARIDVYIAENSEKPAAPKQ